MESWKKSWAYVICYGLATNLVDEDILIGMMDSPELANVAKSGHNLHLRLIERHMTL